MGNLDSGILRPSRLHPQGRQSIHFRGCDKKASSWPCLCLAQNVLLKRMLLEAEKLGLITTPLALRPHPNHLPGTTHSGPTPLLTPATSCCPAISHQQGLCIHCIQYLGLLPSFSFLDPPFPQPPEQIPFRVLPAL